MSRKIIIKGEEGAPPAQKETTDVLFREFVLRWVLYFAATEQFKDIISGEKDFTVTGAHARLNGFESERRKQLFGDIPLQYGSEVTRASHVARAIFQLHMKTKVHVGIPPNLMRNPDLEWAREIAEATKKKETPAASGAEIPLENPALAAARTIRTMELSEFAQRIFGLTPEQQRRARAADRALIERELATSVQRAADDATDAMLYSSSQRQDRGPRSESISCVVSVAMNEVSPILQGHHVLARVSIFGRDLNLASFLTTNFRGSHAMRAEICEDFIENCFHLSEFEDFHVDAIIERQAVDGDRRLVMHSRVVFYYRVGTAVRALSTSGVTEEVARIIGSIFVQQNNETTLSPPTHQNARSQWMMLDDPTDEDPPSPGRADLERMYRAMSVERPEGRPRGQQNRRRTRN